MRRAVTICVARFGAVACVKNPRSCTASPPQPASPVSPVLPLLVPDAEAVPSPPVSAALASPSPPPVVGADAPDDSAPPRTGDNINIGTPFELNFASSTNGADFEEFAKLLRELIPDAFTPPPPVPPAA